MRKANSFVNIVLLLMVSWSCAKKVTVDVVRFGTGGGFAGRYNTYSLRANGVVSKIDGGVETTIRTIDPDSARLLLQDASAFSQYRFNEPGNMSSFIEIKSDSVRKIIWPVNSEKVEPELSGLFDRLMALTK